MDEKEMNITTKLTPNGLGYMGKVNAAVLRNNPTRIKNI
jgi:hypothetical protein